MPFMYKKFVMTLLCAFTFCGGFQHYYFSFRFRNEMRKYYVDTLSYLDLNILLMGTNNISFC